MLPTTTKQINAYGKRSKRVIDVPAASDTTKPAPTALISIFDDLPTPPPKTGLASRMKRRENKPPSLKAVGKQTKKKRMSAVISPFKKPIRVTQLIQEAGIQNVEHRVHSGAKLADRNPTSDGCSTTNPPARAPLSSFSVNIPGSPAYMRSPRPRHSSKSISLKLAKPSLVDVDIIVMDDKGHVVGKERRSSRTGVDAKRAKRAPTKPSKAPSKPQIDVDSESDEPVSQPVRPKRTQKRQPVVTSDASDSDIEIISTPVSPVRPKKQTIPLTRKPISRMSTVEVLIPPAPYHIPQCPSTPLTPKAAPAATRLPSKSQRPATPPVPKAVNIATRPPPAFHLPPSPVFKVRPSTPIRGHRKGFFEPPSPPSPSVTDCDLSLDFSELAVGDDSAIFEHAEQDIPKHLLPLLEECGQEHCGPHDFSSFIESFPFDPILQHSRSDASRELTFKKIGEASYSEVFGIGDVVLKVIPLRDESNARGEIEDEGPLQSDAQDVRKEIIVTRAMGEVDEGFVKFLKTYIVKGKYPQLLLHLWDEYDKCKGSESIRPDTFKLSQVYAIIVLPNGGSDLESYSFTRASKVGWRQASSIFWQVAKSLAHAEHLVSFEHRDLHWGQVLVKNAAKAKLKAVNLNAVKSRKRKMLMDDVNHGVQTTIIDLGLSRMDAGDGDDGDPVQWTPFDEEVFMGEGEYQFDVYRMMRTHTGNDWEGYHPLTNVMWLHYLLTKLLTAKGLKVPSARKNKAEAEAAPASFEDDFSEKDCYEALVDVEQWLGSFLSETFPSKPKAPAKAKSRRKTIVPVQQDVLKSGPISAGEVVQYGVKKGWISSIVLH